MHMVASIFSNLFQNKINFEMSISIYGLSMKKPIQVSTNSLDFDPVVLEVDL